MDDHKYGNLQDFIARASYDLAAEDEFAERPIALLIGSGLSLPAVPGVMTIVSTIRKILPPDNHAEFDQELAKIVGSGEKYQAAFRFLARRRPTVMRDRVIQTSVLHAYPAAHSSDHRMSDEELLAAELDVDGWDLPPGLAALGRIWAGLPPRLRGPIITTNFDPLLEVALRRAGATAVTHVMDSDGSISQALRLSESANVMHIHGFWREGTTLSMASQLTQDRPVLGASLRSMLAEHTLWVFGYSGWRDAVMISLRNVLAEQEARKLDVLWCAYSDSTELEQEVDSNGLLSELLRTGNVQFYAGCNGNQWLPALEDRISDQLNYVDTSRLHASEAALIDWDLVDTALLTERAKEDGRDRAMRFLDGREPTLRDGFNPLIAKRDIVQTICNQLRISRNSGLGPTLTLLVGASGEGKSTALLQIAAMLASEYPEAAVLVNQSGKLNADEVMRMDPHRETYLLLDEAQRAASDMRELCKVLNARAGRPLHLLVAARDTDWSSVGGFTFAWRNYIEYRVHRLRGLSHVDAVSILAAWDVLGDHALGRLKELPSGPERVERLLEAAGANAANGGTLFGASLALRYADGLQEHVRQLLLRLRDVDVVAMNGSRIANLANLFVMISLAHSNGVRMLGRPVLARAMALSVVEADSLVLGPLGDEAPISVAGEWVETRHRSIAETVVALAEDEGFDLAKSVSDLVTSAVELIEEGGITPDLMGIAYMSRNIGDKTLALVAARAAAEASPHRLSYRGRLSSALRACGRIPEAVALGETSLRESWRASDREYSLRYSLNELGVSYGMGNMHAQNVFFSAASMADLPDVRKLTKADAEYPLTCVGIAACHAWEAIRSYGLIEGIAAVIYLLDRLNSRLVRRDWIAKYKETVLRGGGRKIGDLGDAIAALGNMSVSAADGFEDFGVAFVPRDLTFRQLFDCFDET